uniref:ATP synthase F0 subunit 8 n=1 Tax=Pedinomonas minor TaxID=3159 RepID=Q9ZY29_PEDMN|nr:ATP synthase F0 subunit 8 [Pedinomonas minor]AAD19665.1 ATP synthase F0 subunit 8 [Pedinomonas minor]
MPQFDFTNWTILVISIFLFYLFFFSIFVKFFMPRIVRFLKVSNKVLID